VRVCVCVCVCVKIAAAKLWSAEEQVTPCLPVALHLCGSLAGGLLLLLLLLLLVVS